MHLPYKNRIVLVDDLLRMAACHFPDKVALICEGVKFTYRFLDEFSDQISYCLHSLSVQKGDRVLIVLPNSMPTVAAFFGAIKLGCIACILHPDIKEEKLRMIISETDANTIIVDKNIFNELNKLKLGVKNILLTSEQSSDIEIGYASSRQTFSNIQKCVFNSNHIDQDLAFLIYTSGSTGNPKGVMCNHHSVVSAANSISQYLNNTSDDIIANMLPLSFTYGLYQILTAFYVGATVLLEKNFNFPYVSLNRMKEEQVTGLPGVPTLFSIMLKLRLKMLSIPSLRYITSSGDKWSVDNIKSLARIFPQVKIYSMYGLTECARATYLPPEEIFSRPGSIGQSIPNEDIWVIDENGNRLGAGQIGELVIRGANVMSGYWRRPIETESTFRVNEEYNERVLHTGDLVWIDEDGFVYFVGRRDHLIKTGGIKIYPREVEEILYSLSDIREAVVIGKDHPLLGQIVAAYVVLFSGSSVTTEEIINFCTLRLEGFAVPREIHICNDLPRTTSGKVDQYLLKKGGWQL